MQFLIIHVIHVNCSLLLITNLYVYVNIRSVVQTWHPKPHPPPPPPMTSVTILFGSVLIKSSFNC